MYGINRLVGYRIPYCRIYNCISYTVRCLRVVAAGCYLLLSTRNDNSILGVDMSPPQKTKDKMIIYCTVWYLRVIADLLHLFLTHSQHQQYEEHTLLLLLATGAIIVLRQ